MKTVITLFALCFLPACASLQQGINAGEVSALVSIRAAEDNNISLWRLNACGTPFSAAIRNPDIVQGLMALCLPAGNASNPANLLNAIPKP
jgi:hypothetical protein